MMMEQSILLLERGGQGAAVFLKHYTIVQMMMTYDLTYLFYADNGILIPCLLILKLSYAKCE